MAEYILEDGKWNVIFETQKSFKCGNRSIKNKEQILESLKEIQYTKLERFGLDIQGTVKIPIFTQSESKEYAFAFFASGNVFIIIEEEGHLEKLFQEKHNIEEKHESLTEFLLDLVEVLLEDDVWELRDLEEEFEEMEESLLQAIPKDFYEKIRMYRRNLSFLHRYYEEVAEICDQMQGQRGAIISDQEVMEWKHVGDRALRFYNHVEQLKEYLVHIRELYQSQMDLQQNRVISLLTIVTTIFLPLTLIVGWYGMNFTNMPELDWKYGYVSIIILSIATVVGEVIYFKKKKFL